MEPLSQLCSFPQDVHRLVALGHLLAELSLWCCRLHSSHISVLMKSSPACGEPDDRPLDFTMKPWDGISCNSQELTGGS